MRLGRSRPAVSNTIRLLTLPAQVQRAVAGGEISAGHAEALLGLHGQDAQETWPHGSRPTGGRCGRPSESCRLLALGLPTLSEGRAPR